MILRLVFLIPAFVGAEPGVEAAARDALRAVPGETAFLFAELRDGEPGVLFGFDHEKRFAVGSTFKLFVFGALADDVNRGRRRLDDVVALRPEWIGPPGSEMARWPSGAPVTLHTLALKMISVSDNTATDHLIHLLGRERIEAQTATMGHGRPEVNLPLLTTREMVLLQDRAAGLPGRAYQGLNVDEKRRFLAERTSGPPQYQNLDFDASAYRLAEWYASPLDMAQGLGWIERHTREGSPAHPLRAVLAVDSKLPHDAEEWPFVGFKGGSEDQLIAGNWLLRRRDGRWYTLHLYANSPESAIDLEEFAEVCETVFKAVERGLKGDS